MNRTLIVIASLLALATCASAAQPTPLNERLARPSPEWVTRGVMYQIQPRAFTPEGTLQAAQTRLRPILLTSLTTVLGSLTIATDPVWSGLAWAIAFGLTIAFAFQCLMHMAVCLDLVPPTVIRDGPLGEGSVQWFVDADHHRTQNPLIETGHKLRSHFGRRSEVVIMLYSLPATEQCSLPTERRL